MKPFENLQELEDQLLGMGHTPSAEATGLTELDHGLQCAAELGAYAPDDLELGVAGLLHDVGHGFSPVRSHDEAGAEALRPLLGRRIAELVGLHIRAKRYLVTTDAAYRGLLSPLSVKTLALQGGDMTPAEVAAFEAEPYARDAVRLRRADEAAKVVGRPVAGLEAWLPAIRKLVKTGL
jgi:predicted HD phosphohydrolase